MAMAIEKSFLVSVAGMMKEISDGRQQQHMCFVVTQLAVHWLRMRWLRLEKKKRKEQLEPRAKANRRFLGRPKHWGQQHIYESEPERKVSKRNKNCDLCFYEKTFCREAVIGIMVVSGLAIGKLASSRIRDNVTKSEWKQSQSAGLTFGNGNGLK